LQAADQPTVTDVSHSSRHDTVCPLVALISHALLADCCSVFTVSYKQDH
jgi:hypothetical protein